MNFEPIGKFLERDADNPLRQMGDVNFYVPSHSYGPVEVVHAALTQFLTDALKAR